MKEIKAFIRPKKVNEVAVLLRKNGFCCFTVFEGDGYGGNYSDPLKEFPSLKHPYLHSKISKIEIVCNDEEEQRIKELIKKGAWTGESGDGLIYVVNVDSKMRIRDNKN